MDVLYVPGGCTSLVQVMDVWVNSVFKGNVRKQFLSWKSKEIQVRASNENGIGDQRFVSFLLQAGNLGAKPTRELLVDWVLEGWEDFPLDQLQRGMEALILEPALAPLPPPLSPMPPRVVSAVLPSDMVATENALSLLGSLEGQEDEPMNLPDELDPPSDPEPEAPVAPLPTVLPLNAVCLQCERPMRSKNSAPCVRCHAWHHIGCLADSDPAICPICQ